MTTQMRLALQSARAIHNEALIEKGKTPIVKISGSVRDVFRLATIQGAKAVHMADQIGSLVEVEQGPVAAIVLHASMVDIDMVIVDGVVRKRAGQLVKVQVEEGLAGIGKSVNYYSGWPR